MKPAYFCGMLGALVFSMPHLNAQEMPEHVVATLNKVVGKWTMERVVGGKKADSKFEMDWAIPKTTLLFRWRGTDSLTGKEESSVGILGWDPVKQLIVEHEIGSGGFTADCTHLITPDGKWVSPSTGTSVVNGKPVIHQSRRVIEIISNDEWTVTAHDSVVDGKPQTKDVTTLRRQTQGQNPTGMPPKIRQQIDKHFVGEWTFDWSYDGQAGKGTYSVAWSSGEDSVVGTQVISTPNGNLQATVMTGWDAESKSMVMHYFCSNGDHLSIQFPTLDDSNWKGSVSGTFLGEAITGPAENRWGENRIDFQSSVNGKTYKAALVRR